MDWSLWQVARSCPCSVPWCEMMSASTSCFWIESVDSKYRLAWSVPDFDGLLCQWQELGPTCASKTCSSPSSCSQICFWIIKSKHFVSVIASLCVYMCQIKKTCLTSALAHSPQFYLPLNLPSILLSFVISFLFCCILFLQCHSCISGFFHLNN